MQTSICYTVALTDNGCQSKYIALNLILHIERLVRNVGSIQVCTPVTIVIAGIT